MKAILCFFCVCLCYTVYGQANGYKSAKLGLGLGAHYFVGKEGWLGADLSLINYFDQGYKVIVARETDVFAFEGPDISADVFKFGYSHSLKAAKNDISFSLFEVNSPVVLSPVRFGYLFGNDMAKSSLYYRPGIGFSVKGVSLSYAYNWAFVHKAQNTSEKNMFYVGYIYPFF